MKLGFDLISDLNLTTLDKFDWSDKATSLYCIVAGNVSSDIRIVAITLAKLSTHYQGVFYIPGSLEFTDCHNVTQRINELERLCKRMKNVVLLYHNVVVIDGVAVLGVNGWYDHDEESMAEMHSIEDIAYLKNSVEKLQKHIDVKKIIIASNAVPDSALYFNEPADHSTIFDLSQVLITDLEKKVSHWVFGSTEKIVDTVINNVNYLSNPAFDKKPYWAKRIELSAT